MTMSLLFQLVHALGSLETVRNEIFDSSVFWHLDLNAKAQRFLTTVIEF